MNPSEATQKKPNSKMKHDKTVDYKSTSAAQNQTEQHIQTVQSRLKQDNTKKT